MQQFKFKTKPYDYQYNIWNETKSMKAWPLLMDMGTGKTKVSIDTAAYMYSRGYIDAVILLAPCGTYINWVDELAIHMPDFVPYKTIIWKSVMRKNEEQTFVANYTSKEMCLKVFVMNYEAIIQERSRSLLFKFANSHKVLTILDESSCIKNPKSKTTKYCLELSQLSTAKRILTGSAVDNSPLNIWAQFQFLGNGILGHTSYYSFSSEYAEFKTIVLKAAGPHQGKTREIITGYKNLDKLKAIIQQNATIIRKEDALPSLPEKLYDKIHVPLTPQQKQMYTQLKKESYLLFKNIEEEQGIHAVTTKIVLTQIVKLTQIAIGFVVTDEGKVVPLESNRTQTLLDTIELITGKVLIWSYNIYSIECIVNALSETYGKDSVQTYYGATSSDDRARARKDFKAGSEGESRFLVGNPLAGAYGTNLTGINTVIYFDNVYDAELRNQSEDRCHRIGQVSSVLYLDLFSRGTCEEKVLTALRNKKLTSNFLMASNYTNQSIDWRNMLSDE